MELHWLGQQMLLVSFTGFTIWAATFTSLEGAKDNCISTWAVEVQSWRQGCERDEGCR